MALCDIYLKPTPNRSRNGELQVDEEEEVEEEGSATHCLDDVYADRLVRPRPRSCSPGNNRGETPVASTGGRPLAIRPITARPGPSMPFMGYCNHQSSLIRPGGPRAMGYSSSHPIRPFSARHQPGHVARSSGFGNAGGLLRPEASCLPNGNTVHTMSPVRPLVHSSYCDCVVSAVSSFRNLLMPPPEHMPHGEMSSPEFDVAAASSSQYHQLPPQIMPPPQYDFEARQPMPSDSETSPQTTPWPLPNHWC